MCNCLAGGSSGGVDKAQHLKRKVGALFPTGLLNSHSLLIGLCSFVVRSAVLELCGLCTKGSRASSLLFDSCDMPERLEDDMDSLGRFPSNFLIVVVPFLCDNMIESRIGWLVAHRKFSNSRMVDTSLTNVSLRIISGRGKNLDESRPYRMAARRRLPLLAKWRTKVRDGTKGGAWL